MKTLINKNNPQIRIIAPEFKISGTGRYYIPVKRYCTLTWLPENWTLIEEEPTCKESLQVEEEHPDNFTSFEWLIGRLMFRGCDLWGMTDGEDDNGVVTKLIKDRAAEMLELLERELDSNAEPVDLEKEITAYIEKHFHIRYDETLEVGNDPLTTIDFYDIARHFYELGRKGGRI